MLNTITTFESEKSQEVKHTSFVKSDDGTIVFFKDQYDPNTGTKLEKQVIKVMSGKEIQDEIAKKQTEIDVLQGFLDEV